MPIDVATGVLHFSSRDITLPGRFPMRWERNFSSAPGAPPSSLGPGWTSPFFAKLTRIGKNFHFLGPPGGLVVFPDPHEQIERGSVVRSLGDFMEITKHGYLLRVTRWNPDNRSISRFSFQPGRNGDWWNLHSLEDAASQGLDFAWDDRGLLQGARQRIGNRTLIFAHSDSGRLVSASFRSRDGRVQSLARYEYDAEGRLAAAFDGLGQVERFGYDSQGRLVRESSKDGGVLSYKYDDRGRCVRSSGLNGYDLKTIRYMDHIGFTESKDSYGKATQYQWLPSGQVVLEMDPMGGRFQTEYDGHGRITRKIDPLNGAVGFDYDEAGNRRAITDALGNRMEFEFNENRQVVSYTDKAGGEWKRTYDPSGRLVLSVNPMGAEYAIAYDQRGLPVSVTAPDGARKVRKYSEAGDLIEETDWQGNPTLFSYDEMGRRNRITDADGRNTGLRFDLIGQLVELSLPSGSRFRFTFDAGGNRTSITDGQGRKTLFKYGPCRRMLEKKDRTGGRVKYRWGTEPSRLLGIINEKNEEHRFYHDACGRVIKERSFDGRELKYEYDSAGRNVAYVNALGERIAFRTNALGQTIGKTLPDGSSLRFIYDKLGNLSEAHSPDGIIILTRDKLGRLLKEEQDSDWVESRYGVRGRLEGSESSLGRSFDIERDDGGNATVLKLGTGEIFRFSRDGLGREKQISLPCGLKMESGYDFAGRLVSQKIAGENDSQVSASRGDAHSIQRDYHYDASGNIQSAGDSGRGRTRYTYDANDRILSVSSEEVTDAFTYDECGNVSHAILSASETHFAHGPGNRLTKMGSTAFEYDLQGRLVKRTVKEGSTVKEWLYTWDSLDQLRSLKSPDGGLWTYHYDALGRRIRKQGPEGVIRYIWDRDTIIHEISGNGRQSTWIYRDDSFAPLASIQGSKVFSVLNDHLGTPKELVAPDGRVSWSARYRAWGDLQSLVAQDADCPIRFQGQWSDEESGLHYNNFRYYDPSGMRYISQDPISLRGGLNLYAYVRNPITLLDPLGLCEEFPNQLPDELPRELERADALGVKPMSPADPGFEAMVNSGKVKWVVTTDGDLRVIPHSIDGQGEIPHTAASRGSPVLAAGEADIAAHQGGFFGTEIDNHSGHYKPSEESTQVGRDAFSAHGITFPD